MFKRGLVLGARLNVQNQPYGKITIQIILAISLKRGTPFLTRTNGPTKHTCFGPTVPNLPMKHSTQEMVYTDDENRYGMNTEYVL